LELAQPPPPLLAAARQLAPALAASSSPPVGASVETLSHHWRAWADRAVLWQVLRSAQPAARALRLQPMAEALGQELALAVGAAGEGRIRARSALRQRPAGAAFAALVVSGDGR